MKRSKPRRHEIDLFGATIHTATNLKQWAKIRSEVDSIAEDPGGLGYTSFDLFETDAGHCIPHISIFINLAAHDGDQLLLINTCAHEATHAAALLLDHIEERGALLSETLCYLTGAITATLWSHATAEAR